MLSLERSYGFLITKELIFGFQILDLKDHFSASLITSLETSESEPSICVMNILKKPQTTMWSSSNIEPRPLDDLAKVGGPGVL